MRRSSSGRFVAGMEALRVGDPMDESTQVGPLATPEILEGLDEQVRAVGGDGRARAHRRASGSTGRAITTRPRCWRMCRRTRRRIARSCSDRWPRSIRADGIDEAIRLANDTEFGLGASAWTNDEAEQRRFIDEIEAGMVFINGMVASDPRLPFGGVKRSGYGRELGACGIREFVNVKTVRVA